MIPPKGCQPKSHGLAGITAANSWSITMRHSVTKLGALVVRHVNGGRRSLRYATERASVVKGISQRSSKPLFQVRVLAGVPINVEGKRGDKKPFLPCGYNYYMTSNRVKIKCRGCGAIFYQDMFQMPGSGATCKCSNLSIQVLAAPETRFGYWFTVKYAETPPLIVEKKIQVDTSS